MVTKSEIEYVRHPESPAGSPPVAVRAGDLVFVGGQLPVHPIGGIPAETLLSKGMPFHGSLIEKQLRYLYSNLDTHLAAVGTSLKKIMKINSFQIHGEDIDMALRIRRDWFDRDTPPPSTMGLVTELPARGARVMIDLINVAEDANLPMTSVKVTKSPSIAQVKSIGWPVYSQVVKGGGFVFTRGTTTQNANGPLPEMALDHPFPYALDQVEFQLRYQLDRMKELLADAGCSLSDAVKAEILLSDMSDIVSINKVWAEYFPVNPPARVIVPIAKIPPMRIESEVIAVDPNGPYKKEMIHTDDVPTPMGPEPQAVKAGPYVFISGQMATDYKSGLAPEASVDPRFPNHASSAKLQAQYILKNVDAICRAAGTSAANIVKRRIHHTDLNEMPKAEAVWRSQLGDDRIPPTSTFRGMGPLPVPDCTIQYDLIAYAPD